VYARLPHSWKALPPELVLPLFAHVVEAEEVMGLATPEAVLEEIASAEAELEEVRSVRDREVRAVTERLGALKHRLGELQMAEASRQDEG
jgi:hypothetical protein